jgi:hypothetical protein
MTSPSEAVDTIEKALEGAAALVERDVLKELAKHWNATGTAASPLFKSKIGDKVALFAIDPSAMAEVLTLARKAEAMEREMAEQLKVLDELFDNVQRRTKAGMSWGINGHPTLSPASLHILSVARHRARALIGGDNAQG